MSSGILDLDYQTPSGWAATALENPEGLLSDHAHCEKKAAVSALNLSLSLAEVPKASILLARLAEEELNHYRRVLEILHACGWRLQPDRGNAYANAMLGFAAKDGPRKLLDRLLAAALIEARSCERLRLLEQESRRRPEAMLGDWPDLLLELERCEAGHAAVYRSLAMEMFGETVPRRLEEWLKVESRAIQACPWRSAIH